MEWQTVVMVSGRMRGRKDFKVRLGRGREGGRVEEVVIC